MNGCAPTHTWYMYRLVMYLVFRHDWFGVRARVGVYHESYYFLLNSDQWLDICFFVVVSAPYRYIEYEVGVY